MGTGFEAGMSTTRTTAVTVRPWRLVVPAPEAGFLALLFPTTPEDRRALVDGWRHQVQTAAMAARTPALARVKVRATAYPVAVSAVGTSGPVHVAEDVRPTLNAVYAGLVAVGVLPGASGLHVLAERLELGAAVGAAQAPGHLVLELTEVRP